MPQSEIQDKDFSKIRLSLKVSAIIYISDKET